MKLLRQITLLLFIFSFSKTFYGQTFDSIINVKPSYSITKDTLIQGKKFNRIDFDERQNIIALGNVTKDGIKNGYWIYYSSINHKQICEGEFKKGLKNGWWYTKEDDCKHKFKRNRPLKLVCHF